AFPSWSPWAELDPQTRYRYSGPRQGVGAAMSWESTDNMVGRGSQVIVASEPNDRVRMRLQFGADRTAMTELQLTPSPSGGTRVTWVLELDFGGSILQRYLGAFVQEGAVGRDYERGLNNLKTLLERGESRRTERT
ncbi:MAG: SRPBCC family protein, partial [Pseudomonadota bacterium]